MGTPTTDTFQWMDNNLPGCVPPLRIFILKWTGDESYTVPFFCIHPIASRPNKRHISRIIFSDEILHI
ncbi:hypothetical protein LEP1GSC038_3371 [Leptospira weilii str. 2006001855]|uniref:Uncharacterized protein n=1 Tax=Leptospira weilii str. 2006001855 TaxID=996804 RepID=M6FI06_9LEPT|nr:hypothetical protein LEP1GSC038_3371 [Leptospira weilii str. 2006001855]